MRVLFLLFLFLFLFVRSYVAKRNRRIAAVGCCCVHRETIASFSSSPSSSSSSSSSSSLFFRRFNEDFLLLVLCMTVRLCSHRRDFLPMQSDVLNESQQHSNNDNESSTNSFPTHTATTLIYSGLKLVRFRF